MVLTPLEAVVSMALNAVSRRFEYQADRFACELRTQLKSDDMADMGARLGRALRLPRVVLPQAERARDAHQHEGEGRCAEVGQQAGSAGGGHGSIVPVSR